MAAVLSAYRKAAPAALTHLVSTHRCTQMVIARLLAAAYELNFAIDRMTPLADALMELADHLTAGPCTNLLWTATQPEAARDAA